MLSLAQRTEVIDRVPLHYQVCDLRQHLPRAEETRWERQQVCERQRHLPLWVEVQVMELHVRYDK